MQAHRGQWEQFRSWTNTRWLEIFFLLALRLGCHNLWGPMNNQPSRALKANKRKDWGTCAHGNTNWKTNSPKVLGLVSVKGSVSKCSSGESSRLVSWLPPLMSWFHHPGKSNTSSFATVITGWPRSVSFSTSRRGVTHKEGAGSKAKRHSASHLFFRQLVSFRSDWTLRSQFGFSWCDGNVFWSKDSEELDQDY